MSDNYVGNVPGINTAALAALIGQPNGIAGLDAAAKLFPANFRLLKAVTFTRDSALASGNQAVTGAGFKPRAVIFFGTATPGSAVGQASFGMAADGTPIANAVAANSSNAVAQTWIIGVTRCIQFVESAGNQYEGAVTTFDADGFTIAWVKTGAKTGVMTILAFCIA